MTKKVTVIEIAKKAKVSTTTVMNVINGRTDKMREETYNRIMEIIESTGYVKKVAPALLSKKTSRMVAVMIGRDILEKEYQNRIVSIIVSLEQKCVHIEYYLLFHVFDKIDEIICFSEAWQLEGILMFGENQKFASAIIENRDISVKNIDSNMLEIWSDDEIEELINDFVKELLA